MGWIRGWTLALVLALAAVAQAGDFYKCIGPDGGMTFQDTPCSVGKRTTKYEDNGQSQQKKAAPPAALAPEAALPTIAVPPGQAYAVDRSALEDPAWKDAIAQAESWSAVRAGAGQLTLFRVLLEGAAEGDSVQLASAKLNDLDPGDGGRYVVALNGSFVIVEHVPSQYRQAGGDPVHFGGLAHAHGALRAPVPERGKVAVLGDVVIARAADAERGAVEATVSGGGQRGIPTPRKLVLGPITTGGTFGRAFRFDAEGHAEAGGLAPGQYQLLLPDFDMAKSRFEVTVEPGKLTRISFDARGPRDVVKLSEQLVAGPNAEGSPGSARP